jgi:hypothetical protein
MHYEWYLRAREVKLNKHRCEHEADLRLMVIEADILAREMRQDDPLTPEADDDMGWDNPVPALNAGRRFIEQPPPPPNIPLISADDYYEISKLQYEAYVNACRNVVPWRILYPDEHFGVGEKGTLWQDKLSTVNLAPVWFCFSHTTKTAVMATCWSSLKTARRMCTNSKQVLLWNG